MAEILSPNVMNLFIIRSATQVHLNTYIQFGSGDAAESDVVTDPQSVVMEIFGKNYTSDTTFDPTRLSKNKSLGIVPANTTLSIAYRVTNPANSNVAVGSLNNVAHALTEFADQSILDVDEIIEPKNYQ